MLIEFGFFPEFLFISVPPQHDTQILIKCLKEKFKYVHIDPNIDGVTHIECRNNLSIETIFNSGKL